MTPVMMRPAKLAQTAVAAFEEAMALQGRPSSLIRFIADTARARAEDELADVPEAPAREAFETAFHAVSDLVRRVLAETGHLADTINDIRDEAQRLAWLVDASANAEAERSPFVRTARELVNGEGRDA